MLGEGWQKKQAPVSNGQPWVKGTHCVPVLSARTDNHKRSRQQCTATTPHKEQVNEATAVAASTPLARRLTGLQPTHTTDWLVQQEPQDSNHKRFQIQSQAAPTGQTPTSEKKRQQLGRPEKTLTVYVPQAGPEIQTLSKLLESSAEITGVVTTNRPWLCTLLPFSTFKDFVFLESLYFIHIYLCVIF